MEDKMNPDKIEGFEELLSNYLANNQQISKYEISRLTEPGENYCSLMLAVKLFLKNQNGKVNNELGVEDGVLNVVAKLQPPSEFLRTCFNTELTFRNEINFYQEIIPTLRNFLSDLGNENPFDCFPEIYAARRNLLNNSENKQCDENAALVLENLKLKNYRTVERTIGFNMDEAKLILKCLAQFHAVPLAMKLLKPEEFKAKLMPFLQEYTLFSLDTMDWEEMTRQQYRDILAEDQETFQFIDRAIEIFDRNAEVFKQPKGCSKYIREPFSTIIHTDMWVNNTMLKYHDDKPVKNKFVDFQIYEYGSLVRDLIFFLFTSVQLPVLKPNVDYLIRYYYDEFIRNVQELNCDIEKFSWANFEEEIKVTILNHEFLHITLLLNPICAPKESVKELSDMDMDTFMEKKELPKIHKDRLIFTVKSFQEHSWF